MLEVERLGIDTLKEVIKGWFKSLLPEKRQETINPTQESQAEQAEIETQAEQTQNSSEGDIR